MFRVLELVDGKVNLSEGTERVAPPPKGTLRWVDLTAQDDAQLELLRSRFDFHPLAIEDCARQDQRPKLEEYGGYMFIVTHGLESADVDCTDLKIEEVHAFLGPDYLVTVHLDKVPAVEAVWKRAAGDAALCARGVDFLYYLVADGVADMSFPLLDRIADDIEGLEDTVLGRAERKDLQRIFDLKRALVTMRKILSPQRDVFGLLARRAGGAQIDEKTAVYFRDIYDHLVRITETIESDRDLLGNALDAYLSMISIRTNEIMKRLALVSTVFLPLTFITGFWGQNFTHLPVGSYAFYAAMLASCAFVPVGLLWWFYRSKWLS